jgi:hypothetical protein
MSSETTRNTLMNFAGAVILQGDDLTQGKGFNLAELTGLSVLANGTTVYCGDDEYNTDNNEGEQFRVSLDPNKFAGAVSATINFNYGNDIDDSLVIPSSGVEVLATAVAGPNDCTGPRPTIVRRLKD